MIDPIDVSASPRPLIGIRPAQLDDAQAIARVHVESWQVAYADLLPAGYLASLSVAHRAAAWRTSIASGTPRLLVACRDDNEVVGWIAFGPCRDPETGPGLGEIWAFYVAPTHWSQGLGRALSASAFRHLAAEVRHAVRVWVLADNLRAIRFYCSIGFARETGITKNVDVGGRSLQEVRLIAPAGST